MEIGGKVRNTKRSGLIRMGKNVNVLRNQNFNNNQFNSSWDTNGVNVSIKPTEEDEYHFKVEESGVNKLKVHGGSWKSYIRGDVEQVPLNVDSGTSQVYGYYKTLTVPGDAISTTRYVVLTLDDGYKPTQLFASLSIDDNYPVDDALNPRKKVIAAITTDSSANISSFEQYWFGGDIDTIDVEPGFFTYANVAASNVYSNVASAIISYCINDSTWRRNGFELDTNAASTNVGSEIISIDPVADNIIGANFSGYIYNYAWINRSDRATSEVNIIPSANKIPSNYSNPYPMEILLSTVHYNGDGIDGIVNHYVGGFEDRLDEHNRDFGITIIKGAEDEVSFDIAAGTYQERDLKFSVTGISISNGDLPKKVWIELKNPSADPSIYPTSVTIEKGTAFPLLGSTYGKHFLELYELDYEDVTLSGSGGTSLRKYRIPKITKLYQGGRVRQDWVRPDGQDFYGPTATPALYDVDTVYPRAKTISFNGSATSHKNELQDYLFDEKVISKTTGPNISQFSGDQITPFYWYEPVGITEKRYARIDAINQSAWGSSYGKSIEIETMTYIMQLKGFRLETSVISPTDHSEFGANKLTVLVRQAIGGVNPTLQYADIQNLKVKDSDHADQADNSNTSNYANYAGYADFANYANYVNSATVFHTMLIYSPSSASDNTDKRTNTDHDHRYAVKGTAYSAVGGTGAWFQTVGRGNSLGNSIPSNSLAIDLTNSKLFIDDTFFTLDWANQKLYYNNTYDVLDWNACTLKKKTAAEVTCNWQTQILYRGGTYTSVDWYGMYLMDVGTHRVDWGNCYLNTGSGSDVLSIDWSTRKAYKSTGVYSFDWQNMQLARTATEVTVDWNAMRLYDTSVLRLDWSNKSLTGDWECTGNFTVDSTKVYKLGTNSGMTATSNVNLVDDLGNLVPIIIRGGILTTT